MSDMKLTRKELLDLVKQAEADGRAFINQVDREGLGMKTVTDHRKRVERFLAELAKLGELE